MVYLISLLNDTDLTEAEMRIIAANYLYDVKATDTLMTEEEVAAFFDKRKLLGICLAAKNYYFSMGIIENTNPLELEKDFIEDMVYFDTYGDMYYHKNKKFYEFSLTKEKKKYTIKTIDDFDFQGRFT